MTDDMTIWLRTKAADIMRAVWDEDDVSPDFLATVLANHWSQRNAPSPINEAAPAPEGTTDG